MRWIATIVVGAISSLLATYYYNSITAGQYIVVVALTLGVATLTLTVALIQMAFLMRASKAATVAVGVTVLRATKRLRVSELLTEVTSEFDFLGIIAKRTVNSDAFKAFVHRSRGEEVVVRFLLLDPESEVFAERARDERESLDAWQKDLESTLTRLEHYRITCGIDIRVRYYNVYPMWRLVAVDKRLIAANAFLPGRRGTESDQMVCRGEASDWAKAFRAHFEAIWRFHSREAGGEAETTRK